MTDIDGIVGTAVTGAVALGALGLVSNMMYGVTPAKKKKKKSKSKAYGY